MNKILASTSVLLLMGGFLIFYNPTKNKYGISDSSEKSGSKIDNQASVTVTVTPILPSEGSEEWKFNIVMDTHSIELDQDMTKVAILIDEQGEKHKALNWNGSVGGHHREGILAFRKITPTPKLVELKISDIGGAIRTFSWQLK